MPDPAASSKDVVVGAAAPGAGMLQHINFFTDFERREAHPDNKVTLGQAVLLCKPAAFNPKSAQEKVVVYCRTAVLSIDLVRADENSFIKKPTGIRGSTCWQIRHFL